VVIFRSQKGSAVKNVPETLPYPVPIQHSFPQNIYALVPLPARTKTFFLESILTGVGSIQPPVLAGGSVLLEGQQLECEADHTLPSNAEIKNEWSYAVTSPYTCVACRETPLPFYSIFRAFSTEVTKKRLLSSSCLTVCNKAKFSERMFLLHLTLADFFLLLPVFKSDNS
jgi:hypothetical protein